VVTLDDQGAVVFVGVGVVTGIGPRLAASQAALMARAEVMASLGVVESKMLKTYCAPESVIARFARIGQVMQARQKAAYAEIAVVRTDAASDGTTSVEAHFRADALELQLEGLDPDDQAAARLRFWQTLIEVCEEQGEAPACAPIKAHAEALPPPGPPKEPPQAFAGGCVPR
jgi:hypothetical protein